MYSLFSFYRNDQCHAFYSSFSIALIFYNLLITFLYFRCHLPDLGSPGRENNLHGTHILLQIDFMEPQIWDGGGPLLAAEESFCLGSLALGDSRKNYHFAVDSWYGRVKWEARYWLLPSRQCASLALYLVLYLRLENEERAQKDNSAQWRKGNR